MKDVIFWYVFAVASLAVFGISLVVTQMDRRSQMALFCIEEIDCR